MSQTALSKGFPDLANINVTVTPQMSCAEPSLQDQAPRWRSASLDLVYPLPWNASLHSWGKGLYHHALAWVQIRSVPNVSQFLFLLVWECREFRHLFKSPDLHKVSLSSDRNVSKCAVTSLMHIIQYTNFDCSYFK